MKKYAETARLLVIGDGSPRDRETIMRQLEAALQSAYEEGKRDAWPEARRQALREARVAVTGAQQSLSAAAAVIDKEIA